MAIQWKIDPKILQGNFLWRMQQSSQNYSIFDASILYLECKWNVFYGKLAHMPVSGCHGNHSMVLNGTFWSLSLGNYINYSKLKADLENSSQNQIYTKKSNFFQLFLINLNFQSILVVIMGYSAFRAYLSFSVLHNIPSQRYDSRRTTSNILACDISF